LKIADFTPGKALNLGFEKAKGEIIVALSGHCVPTNENWLTNLIKDLKNDSVAGVYGKQEPLSISSPRDKRDLYTVFGPEKKVQYVDPFFHNANSAMRKETWKNFPFDETVTNVEDRVWGKQVIESSYSIVYNPEASVYHWHGINHDGDENRAAKVVTVLEQNRVYIQKNNDLISKNHNWPIIITFRKKDLDIFTFDYMVNYIKKIKSIFTSNRVIVLPDDEGLSFSLKSLGFEAPLIRNKIMSLDFMDTRDILKHALKLLFENINYEYIIYLNLNFPMRNLYELKQSISISPINNFDISVHSYKLKHSIFDTEIRNHGPNSIKTKNQSVILWGYFTIYSSKYLISENPYDTKMNLIELNNSIETLELTNTTEWNRFRELFKND
jgi:hypothetical protein